MYLFMYIIIIAFDLLGTMLVCFYAFGKCILILVCFYA